MFNQRIDPFTPRLTGAVGVPGGPQPMGGLQHSGGMAGNPYAGAGMPAMDPAVLQKAYNVLGRRGRNLIGAPLAPAGPNAAGAYNLNGVPWTPAGQSAAGTLNPGPGVTQALPPASVAPAASPLAGGVVMPSRSWVPLIRGML